MAGDGGRSIAQRSLVRLRRTGYRWKGNELSYLSCSNNFAGRRLQVEIIATGGNMRLGDIKNVTAHRRHIKLMLQSKYELPGSSYVNSVVLLSPSLVVAPTAIVCGRCVAHQRRFWTSFWFAFWSPFWSLSRDRCKWVPHCVVPFWSPFSRLCQGQAV